MNYLKLGDPYSVAPTTMAPTDEHWSGVAPGEPFTLTLDYDETYEQQKVEVKLRRNEKTGRPESIDPRWKWDGPAQFGDGKVKTINAAKASGKFTPKKKQQQGALARLFAAAPR